jgi:hypothetical protein
VHLDTSQGWGMEQGRGTPRSGAVGRDVFVLRLSRRRLMVRSGGDEAQRFVHWSPIFDKRIGAFPESTRFGAKTPAKTREGSVTHLAHTRVTNEDRLIRVSES